MTKYTPTDVVIERADFAIFDPEKGMEAVWKR